MSSSRLVQHAHLVWRTERILAELRLKRLLGSLGLQALAALMTGFALSLFELAAYFVLVQTWTAIASAAILGLCNIALAGLLMLIATRRPAGRELKLASEVHQDAINAFTAEIDQAETEAPVSLRTAIESAVLPLLLPLIPLVIQRIRKHKAGHAGPESN
jgi:hypothetical protein